MPFDLEDFDLSKCAKFLPDVKSQTCQYYDSVNEKECGFCKDKDLYRCVADTKRVIPISYSSVNTFLTCHRLYYLQAIMGIRLNNAMQSSALKMGTLWDKCLQNLHGAKIDLNAVVEENEITNKDVGTVKAIYRAYKQLEIVTEPNGELQAKVDITIPFNQTWGNGYPVELLVNGFYDRKYPTYFVENKLSSKPDNYLDPYFIQSQVGVYFLADPSLEYCIMEIVRTPALKAKKDREESDEEWMERVYQDVISRPSHYFIGWNAKTRTYGKKFYRSEFDLEELKGRFTHIFREIFEARICDGWYRNDRCCGSILPGIACDMLPICRTGHMNSNYNIRTKPVVF